MSKFKIPKENWKSIPIDSALFILNESKEYIDYTLKESESITNKSYSLILLLTTILSAIVGYTYDIIVNNNISAIVYLNFFFTFMITFLLVHLSIIVFPRRLMVEGRKPEELARDYLLITPKLTEKENYLSFIIQEIENSQYKIDFNLEKNKKRSNKFKFVIYTIIISLPIYLITAFIFISNTNSL